MNQRAEAIHWLLLATMLVGAGVWLLTRNAQSIHAALEAIMARNAVEAFHYQTEALALSLFAPERR